VQGEGNDGRRGGQCKEKGMKQGKRDEARKRKCKKGTVQGEGDDARRGRCQEQGTR